MFFKIIQVEPLDVNCYILAKGTVPSIQKGDCPRLNNAVCIDPGGSAEKIINILESNNLILEAIINTHAHYDHIGANAQLCEKFNCPVYIYETEVNALKDSVANLSSWFDGELKDGYEVKPLKDRESVVLAGLEFKVIHTPGHTSGSICLLQNGNLFTGDTLFNSSIGRTDLPGSDPDQMKQSLEKLKKLDLQLEVFPGHGDSTKLVDEIDNNPFLN